MDGYLAKAEDGNGQHLHVGADDGEHAILLTDEQASVIREMIAKGVDGIIIRSVARGYAARNEGA